MLYIDTSQIGRASRLERSLLLSPEPICSADASTGSIHSIQGLGRFAAGGLNSQVGPWVRPSTRGGGIAGRTEVMLL